MDVLEAVRPEIAKEQATVSKAVLRAGDLLGLNGRRMGVILGLSEASMSRLRSGSLILDKGSKPFELAVLFIKLFLSLDGIMGGDMAAARAWLHNENVAIGQVPAEAIRNVAGLVNTVGYLDGAFAGP
jgi:hypothetical protein